ncbi:hypothetical protein WN943_002835 [Citrus x changshan-huyou]
MQLQSLQNPLSFYNNPSFWPKLHPVQEKMIQNLQSLNQSCQNPNLQNVLPSSQLGLHEQNVGNFFEQSNSPPTAPQDFPQSTCPVPVSSTDNNVMNSNAMLKANVFEPYNAANQEVSAFQSEIENFLNNNKAVGFTAQEENQIAQFDCFNALNGSNKESLIWWANEFDSKSASSNSWDSTPAIHQSEGMFQDYELEFGNFGKEVGDLCWTLTYLRSLNLEILSDVVGEMGLWTLLEGFLLLANALAIINEDRFLAPRGWSFSEFSVGRTKSLKGQIIGLIYATQYMRVPLILLNAICIVVKLVSG